MPTPAISPSRKSPTHSPESRPTRQISHEDRFSETSLENFQ